MQLNENEIKFRSNLLLMEYINITLDIQFNLIYNKINLIHDEILILSSNRILLNVKLNCIKKNLLFNL